jgi:hypothetical protein
MKRGLSKEQMENKKRFGRGKRKSPELLSSTYGKTNQMALSNQDIAWKTYMQTEGIQALINARLLQEKEWM